MTNDIYSFMDITKEFKVNIGDRIAQGIFVKFLTVDDEDKNIKKRKGGIGSTNKEGK